MKTSGKVISVIAKLIIAAFILAPFVVSVFCFRNLYKEAYAYKVCDSYATGQLVDTKLSRYPRKHTPFYNGIYEYEVNGVKYRVRSATSYHPSHVPETMEINYYRTDPVITTMKNALGDAVVLCILVVLWDALWIKVLFDVYIRKR